MSNYYKIITVKIATTKIPGMTVIKCLFSRIPAKVSPVVKNWFTRIKITKERVNIIPNLVITLPHLWFKDDKHLAINNVDKITVTNLSLTV